MDKIAVGKVLKPQGLLGELKVLPLTDGADRFHEIKEVYPEGAAAPLRVRGVRGRAGEVYIYLDGVMNRDAAEAFRDKLLYIPREEAYKPEGSYFICDIIGCECVVDGKPLGFVKDVLQCAGADIYWVVPEGAKKGVLFPALEDVFLSIDTENKLITLDPKRFSEVASFE